MKNKNQNNYFKNNIKWFTLLFISAVISIVTQFVEWANGQSALDLFRFKQIYENFYVYIFPLIAGILILLLLLFVLWKKNSYPFLNTLLFIAILNLYLIFLIEAVNNDPNYIWDYSGVYLIFLGVLSYLIGILFYFSKKAEEDD